MCAGADHRLVRPDLLLVGGGGLPQAHPGRPPVFDDDLLHRAAGAHHHAVGDRAADDRVEVAVHAAPRNADPAVDGQRDVAAEGRDGHALPVPGGSGVPGHHGVLDLGGLGLAVLVHQVEQRHLEQLFGPDVRLVLLVHLHVGDVLGRHLDLGGMRRAPEDGAQEVLDEGRLSQHAGELGPAHHVLVGERRHPLGGQDPRVFLIREVLRHGAPVHAEAVLVQLELLEAGGRARVHVHGVGGDADAGDGLGVLTRASGLGPLLQHADAGSALPQICRQRDPVGSAAHDHEVIPFILAHRFLPFGAATCPT